MVLKASGPIPASFCLFSSFSRYKFNNTNWKKGRWWAWNSNPGPQDLRCTRNHWAMTPASDLKLDMNGKKALRDRGSFDTPKFLDDDSPFRLVQHWQNVSKEPRRKTFVVPRYKSLFHIFLSFVLPLVQFLSCCKPWLCKCVFLPLSSFSSCLVLYLYYNVSTVVDFYGFNRLSFSVSAYVFFLALFTSTLSFVSTTSVSGTDSSLILFVLLHLLPLSMFLLATSLQSPRLAERPFNKFYFLLEYPAW